MTNQQLIEVILRREVSDIIFITDQLRAHLKNLEPQFVIVSVVNSNGNISEIIQKETGYESYHKHPVQTMTSSRGTNYIKIPKEKWNSELHNKLLKQYEDV